MADDTDPPRKFYDLKPKEFERVNPPPAASTPAPEANSSTPKPTFDPAAPIKLGEIISAANVPGDVLRPRAAGLPGAARRNDVHAVLAENVARETAAGLNQISHRPDRRSRRSRDYFALMLMTNVPLTFLAVYGIRSGNVITAASASVGVLLCSIALTWIMWVVMDKY